MGFKTKFSFINIELKNPILNLSLSYFLSNKLAKTLLLRALILCPFFVVSGRVV